MQKRTIWIMSFSPLSSAVLQRVPKLNTTVAADCVKKTGI
uniref:Uncharacterized protein n=1 Tax=Anopheles albimanus TaxID=7167 RepID=A0A182FWX0_ANOAL